MFDVLFRKNIENSFPHPLRELYKSVCDLIEVVIFDGLAIGIPRQRSIGITLEDVLARVVFAGVFARGHEDWIVVRLLGLAFPLLEKQHAGLRASEWLERVD